MRRLVAPLATAALAGVMGCESEIDEPIVDELVIDAVFLEHSDASVAENSVTIRDGKANSLEWGSPDDPSRPFTYIQLTADAGFGEPGTSRFVGVKVVYTARYNEDAERYEVRDVNFLFQWTDFSHSQYRDALIYQGPNLTLLQGSMRADLVEANPDAEPEEIEALVHAALQETFFTGNDDADRVRPEFWRQAGNDDLLMLVVGDGAARDGEGRRFQDFGLDVIREGNWYGAVAEGFLDAWLWSASRTDPLHEINNPGDSGGAVDPQEGFAGYADDYFISPAGFIKDEGPRLWAENFDPALPIDQRVPLRAWRPQSDPNSGSASGPTCVRENMGLGFPWLHRGSVRGARLKPRAMQELPLDNYRPFLWEDKDPEQRTLWAPGQFVPGYLFGHDFFDRTDLEQFTVCLAGCAEDGNCNGTRYTDFVAPHIQNTLQVRAEGEYNEQTRHWTLEMGRTATTAWGTGNDRGNEVQDFDFTGLLAAGAVEVYVAFALWDDSTDRGPRWGSPPIKIRFEPPPPREEREGAGR